MILVTGATGHIGNVLIRKLLDQGEKVRALVWRDEDTIPLKGLDVEQMIGDVLDPYSLEPAMRGVKTVYHLAGIISIMPGRNPFVWRVNVEGTRNVLEAARLAGIRRLVYTSSIHAIARAPHGVTMDESLGFDQNNPYGEYDRSKAAASLEVQKAAAAGLDAVIVCPTGVIGPYDFRGSEMGEVIRSASEARTVFYVEGAYDFVDVRDVVKAMILLMKSDIRNERFILNVDNIEYKRLFELIAAALGKPAPSIKINPTLSRLAWRVEKLRSMITGIKPLITRETAHTAVQHYEYSNEKIKKELGFEFTPIEETVGHFCRIFLNG